MCKYPVNRGDWWHVWSVLAWRDVAVKFSLLCGAVGEPLDVPQIDNPTEEDIDLWHSRYTQALSKLFHDHKERYADSDVKLIIT